MHVAARPYVMAGAVLAAASLVAVTPLASHVATEAALRAVRIIDTNLVDSSIFNIPFNLFQELINVPANEVDAVTYAAQSLFNSGPRVVVGATNLWDVDPRRRLGRPGNGVRSGSDGGRLDDHIWINAFAPFICQERKRLITHSISHSSHTSDMSSN